jgi:hypothetical protein
MYKLILIIVFSGLMVNCSSVNQKKKHNKVDNNQENVKDDREKAFEELYQENLEDEKEKAFEELYEENH